MGFVRLGIACTSAAIVGLASTLVVLFFIYAIFAVFHASLGSVAVDQMSTGALFGAAISHISEWTVFWFLVSCIGYPLIHFALTRRKYVSRRAYLLMGDGIPIVAMAVITILVPQFKPMDFIAIGLAGGIPAGLVFRSIVRGEVGRSGRIAAAGVSIASLLILGTIGGIVWHFVGGVFPLRMELSYRVHHMTWPTLCANSNLRLFPRLSRDTDDKAVCRALADKGDAIMQVAVADGKFESVNSAERAAWLDKAVAQDYEPAINELAKMLGPFSDDQGIPKDFDKARALYTRSAELGNPITRLILSVAYKKGKGAPQDMVMSLMWEELAISASKSDGILSWTGIQKSYERSAATQPPEVVAEAHKRALEFLATH